MPASFLCAAARTPFGCFGGALAEVRPDDLAATVLSAVLSRSPDLDLERIGDVVWGCANQAGEDNQNVARMAVLLAGLPTSVLVTTVNRLCGSSLDAAMAASRTVEVGDADVVVAGGVESMTRAPWVLPKPSRPFPAGNTTAVSTTITAGNASPLNDGASAVVLGSECAANLLGRAPVARVAGRGAHAVDPQVFGIAPVQAANRGWSAPASAGTTSALSSSTRRSRCSPWRAPTPGRSTRRS